MKNYENSSPSKPQRILVEQKSKTSVAVSTPAFLSLARKAGKSSISLSILEQVYCRGLLAAKYDPKHTLEQQAFHRVDSFIHEGKAYEMDNDLISEIITVPDGKKHMKIIKRTIKGYKERNKPQEIKEGSVGSSALGYLVGRAIRNKWTTGSWSGRKNSKSPQMSRSPQDVIQKKIQDKEINYRVKQGWDKLHPELSHGAKEVENKKTRVRNSMQTGKKLFGDDIRLKTRLRSFIDSKGRRERSAAVDQAAKTAGISTKQAKVALGVPVPRHQRGPEATVAQSQSAERSYQKYWDKKKNDKKGGGGSSIG